MTKVISVFLVIIILMSIFGIIELFFGPIIGIISVVCFVYFYPHIKKLI